MPVMMKMTPRPPIRSGTTTSPPTPPEPELAEGPPWLGMPPGGVGEGVGDGLGEGDGEGLGGGAGDGDGPAVGEGARDGDGLGLGEGEGEGDGLGEGLGEGEGVGERAGEAVASNETPDVPFCGASA